mmetsp:Transcript_16913/g.43345  ORF Transcript_16913/g.43345 Transcript_16913/m.43345 type:complete len:770 (+) Transcript_16913:448-2757(+)
MASPYQVPYGCPAAFPRRFAAAFPDLHDALLAASRASPPVGPARVSWVDVEQWMWPLFMEAWGPWRAARLGLPPLPGTDAAGDPLPKLPLAPLLLYGYSSLVVPEPGFWPAHFRTCGFWLPEGPAWTTEGVEEVALEAPLRDAVRAASSGAAAGAGSPSEGALPILVDFGSMGRLGLIATVEPFAAALARLLLDLGRSGIVLSGGWEPMETACREAAAVAGATISCRQAFPHGKLLGGCALVLHHGGSGTTAAALAACCPQIICPLQFDQFFWAERMAWLGLAPEPLESTVLFGTVPPEDARDNSVGDSRTAVSAQAVNRTYAALRAAADKAMSPSTRRAAAEMEDAIRKERAEAGGSQQGGAEAARRIAAYYREKSPIVYGAVYHSNDGQPPADDADFSGGDSAPSSTPPHQALPPQSDGPTELNELQLRCLPPEAAWLCFGLHEAEEIRREVIDDACYLQHGVSVGPGDVVVDAGANIGLFCAFLLTGGADTGSTREPVPGWKGPPAQIFAVEAVPPIAEVLECNVSQLVNCGVAKPGQVEVVHAALADKAGRRDFVFYPHMAGNSTAKPKEKAGQYDSMSAALRDISYAGQRRYQCDSVTLDVLMSKHGLKGIDLLKIDVEGMELEILQGIEAHTWPRIRQVVAEVHDIGTRLADVVELLRIRGAFDVVTVQRGTAADDGGRGDMGFAASGGGADLGPGIARNISGSAPTPAWGIEAGDGGHSDLSGCCSGKESVRDGAVVSVVSTGTMALAPATNTLVFATRSQL